MLQPAALEKWVQNSMQWSQRDALLAFRFTCLQRWGQRWLT